MCGICGEITFGSELDTASLVKITSAMMSRGPDGSGLYAHGSIGLGHRRLSILDLSAASHQPMVDSELGLSIAFNGCIYNFRDLRKTLEGLGYRFFSTGDTEVVLKAYHAWGPQCVERFKGMFAFAIADRESGRVVLVRDRLGIKPLYYSATETRLRFASTIPALAEAQSFDHEIDPVGLHHFFSFHGAIPAPHSIFSSVKKLPPASILTIERDGTQRLEEYWTLDVGDSGRSLSKQEWIDRLDDALLQSVDRRRISDVPIGVLLSGGLDSSLIVAMLAKLGQREIQTFSIGFEAIDQHSGDEFKYSDIIAERFQTNHRRITVSAEAALAALPAAIKAMSEPMVSHDAVAFYLLSQEVSKHVRVVLTGQGADEVFGGYSWHPRFIRSADALGEYSRAYFDWDHTDLARLLQEKYVEADYSQDFVRDFFRRTKSQRPADQVLQIDTTIMMTEDPVKRVDNMTMAFGLEARVPFLDHEVVELAAQMPAELKIEGGGKYILKELGRRYLPPEIIDRPKGYFPVPALRYLRGPFLAFVRELFDQPAAKARGLYHACEVQRLLANPEAAMSPKGHSRLWQAALLEGWLQAHDF